MKKNYKTFNQILLAIFTMVIVTGMSFSGYGQNMVTNGDLESWTTGNPDNWNHVENITQESTIIHSGTYSAKHQSSSNTKDFGHEYITGIVEGNDYNLSYYYLDNDNKARTRLWAKWKNASGSSVGSTIDNAYSVDNADWQHYTTTITAPAGATQFYLEVRVYKEDNGDYGGYVYYDDFTFESAGAATPVIAKAYSISTTAMDVEYNIDVTSVNASDYSLSGTSAITFSNAAIDGTNAKLVHLTGASVPMVGDITIDNIVDAANTTNFDFYAGIMPVSFVNTTNPAGTMDNTHIATFQGIVSANDAYNNVWFSNASGAYNGALIYDYNFDGLVSVGDEILITANRDEYNNLTELKNPVLLSTVSTGNTPFGPDVINGSDIDENIAADTDPAEKWEGQLVKIENFTVDSYTNYDYRCSWSDAKTTYYFHIGDNVDYHLNNITLNVGETYGSVTGVVDYYSGKYRINPREQADIVASTATARIVGTMQGWNTTDPDYVLTLNANGVWELTKSLDAGDWEYKVLEGDEWSQPNYPSTNQHIILSATDNITWKVNIDDDLVTHTLPVVAGNFFEALGLGSNWDPTNLAGEMTDPENDDIYTLELLLPAGNWECKVTLNNNWDQSTGGNTAVISNGVNATTFTYDMSNNTTVVTGPPPDTATITFVVNDAAGMTFQGFYLKGSWDSQGNYDPSWNGGAEHAQFYDDGTHGDITPNDHIFTTTQKLIVDNGVNTWEWGINDASHNWIDGNWQFTIPDTNPQTLTQVFSGIPNLVITEIMYNPPESGSDSLEYIEIYNNDTSDIVLDGSYFSQGFDFVFPSVTIDSGSYLLLGVDSMAMSNTFGVNVYQWTSGSLSNGGEDIILNDKYGRMIDSVNYDDYTPWPTEPDGHGPSLTLCNPDLDNSLAENWWAAIEFAAVNTANDTIWGTPGVICSISADFVNSDTIIPMGANVQFTDLSYGNISSWAWTFPGGTPETSTEQNPVINYSTPGVYSVSLTVSGQSGTNSITKDSVITVYSTIPRNLVITEIMYNPPEVGTDTLEFIELYNNDTEAINLDGYYFSKGVEFTFPDITLDTAEYMLVAINSAAMNNTFGVSSYQWTSGDLGNNGEDIEIKNKYDIIVDQVNYRDYAPWPTSPDGEGPSLTLCNPDSDNSFAENWSASIEFAAVNTAGDTIYATPGSACIPIPEADFVADETLILIGTSVNFTDISTGEPTSWSWSFEGGTPETSTEQNPVITYNTEGVFDVSLTVTNVSGTDTETKTEYITVTTTPPPPVANFTVDDNTVAVGDNASFTDLSTGDPTSWLWSFEGGTPETSTEQNPVITYNTQGVYDVTLTVSNDNGDSTLVMTDYIIVDYPPVADFVASDTAVELGTSIDFTDLSTGTPTSWAWTFEGATPETSTVQNPSGILYNNLGLFDVTLTVTNDFGTDTKTITDYISVIYDGINDNNKSNSFTIYPNPNNGKFIIKINNDNNNKEIYIYSLIGELIYKSSLNNKITEFDLSQYKKGIYFIKLIDIKSSKYYTKKVLLK